MDAGTRDTPTGPFVVTVVVDMAVTKLDALDVIAFVSDGDVAHAGSAHPRVPLAPGVWAEVQIPKFADPPPLAIDVCSDTSLEAAGRQAALLSAALARVGWRIRGPRAGEE